ncbi:MAG TPA: glycoside hydrolase family 3 C-terminal domain-containing protein [Acidimicrobiales bacterium]
MSTEDAVTEDGRADSTVAGGAGAGGAHEGARPTARRAWMDPQLSPVERAELLLAAATLEDKLAVVHGASFPPGVRADGYVPPNERLGIPALLEMGSGAGVTGGPMFEMYGEPATALPAPIAQAASWSEDLSWRCGALIGIETRTHGANVAIGGDVNIARVPLNGRTFEAYGEDPFLAARLIVAHLRGIQEQGVVATVKHYALNNQETNRGNWNYPSGAPAVDARIGERALRQIYLPAFEAAVTEAEVGVVMCAYNRVAGEYCSANRRLLTEILKEEWGFTGWVVSDWWATHDTVAAALAGLDQEMPFGDHFGEALEKAIRSGEVAEEVLDDKARRIWRTMFRLGLFDEQAAPDLVVAGPDHLRISEEAATAGAVLLKNDGTLPLDPAELRTVAVIGADADATAAVVAGGGSSHVLPAVSDTVLSALRDRLPGCEVVHVPATDPVQRSVVLTERDPVPSWVLRTGTDERAERGLRATYYPEPGFAGEPLDVRVDPYVGADWRPGRRLFNGDVSSVKPTPRDAWSITWEGAFRVPATGRYTFELTSVDGSRLLWDGEVLIDNGGVHGPETVTASIELTAGDTHAIRVEYSPEPVKTIERIKLGWDAPPEAYADGLRDAVEAAARADVAIVVARDIQCEGRDQASLHLPNGQDRLIEAVSQANPRTVVVLRTGGPVLMPWIDRVPAVLEAWYGGSCAGAAITRLLTGESVPSGKLPITFPRSQGDLPTRDERQFPGVDSVVEYAEGLEVGYRHYDAHGIEPLFPFGHGLSYTEFHYEDLAVAVDDGSAGGDGEDGPVLDVAVRLRNVGPREGTEVAQVYLSLPPDAGEPPQRLVGFRRVTLLPGEARTVTVRVRTRDLSIWDEAGSSWRVARGRYEVRVGGSSRDLPLRTSVVVP